MPSRRTRNKYPLYSNLTDQEHRQLELLYQNVTSNLEVRKKQQWQVLVSYSAAVAFLISQINIMGEKTRIFVFLLIAVGAYVSRKFFLQYQKKMEVERKLLDRLYKQFSRKFNLSRKLKGSVTESDCFEEFLLRGANVYFIVVVVLSTLMIFYGQP